MGLTESRDYTASMMRDSPPVYLSGDLKVCPALGQVTTVEGATVRLGPVNMKVLEALLIRSGSVVSRGELYQAVWKNQAVGEDALTRCISDIRAELRGLSGRDWIETLPKRGYRWIGDVRQTSLAEDASPEPVREGVQVPEPPRRPPPHKVLRLAARGVGYLFALVVMASLVIWVIDRFAGPPMPVVAVLPVEAGPAGSGIASELDLELAGFLMGLEQIRVLSRSAIESRPANPFPFFYYEFGAQWLIESDLREVAGHRVLTISVADARTGIVEFRVTETIDDSGSGAGRMPGAALSSLGRFIGSELSR